MFKSNGGFTLVELIVVIAILGILAAVTVPAYSGYIAKANGVQAELNEAAAERAVIAACSFYGVPVTNAVKWELQGDTIVITGISPETTQDAVNTYANDLY